MKLYFLGVFNITKSPAIKLCAEEDLSSWGRWTQGTYHDFMVMISKTVAERTKPGQRQSVEEKGKGMRMSPLFSRMWSLTIAPDVMIHCYARSEGVAGVMITDADYPAMAAHRVLGQMLDKFLSEKPLKEIMAATQDDQISFPQLKEDIKTYQNPKEADSIARIQAELDETKVVLHKAIENVLQRGEKLDDLVNKSNDLSMTSRAFYKQAKKQNSCCVLM
ncbi:Longin-like domain-containing protein [Diplogelasinospora grovesii]|uniref:Longin-like domain-containing protein n=1 Tax=Diplogelasinospora grovesii TaxID=303347 RepID=A0AAN6S4P8_9PEZI|nr:Longin-like domain-containing protein [Diplogelasinospora grovesii]